MVHDDSVEPRTKTALPTEKGQPFPDVHKHFLGQVGRFFAIVQYPVRQGKDIVLLLCHQLGKSVGISLLAALQQRRIRFLHELFCPSSALLRVPVVSPGVQL
jgi:hypothetical protein